MWTANWMHRPLCKTKVIVDMKSQSIKPFFYKTNWSGGGNRSRICISLFSCQFAKYFFANIPRDLFDMMIN